MEIRYRYIVWNNLRKFHENHINSFWTTRLSVGMAGKWYLCKHFSDFTSASVMDLNSRREFNCYRKTRIVFIIEEL